MRQNSLLVLILAGLALSPGAWAQYSGSFNAQPGIDLSGAWSPAPHEENIGNPAIADYLGVPINDAARAVGLAWSPSRVTVPEHQCQVHVAPYLLGGPLNLRVWEERDPQSQKLLDIRLYISTYEQNRTIWMDDRPHPPEAAAHTWMGFSTGKWEGNTLTVYTTHMKTGYLRRNGLPESDQATLIEHFMRHGDVMVHVSEVTDPSTLTEPFVRTQVFRRINEEGQNWLYPCESVVEIANQPRGLVPNFLPGQNPFVSEFAAKYGIPLEAALGGAETMYPEFQQKMKGMAVP
ncbi:MAG TPA: hypothetical protein VK724_22940, partial [Bryobacteraceae bacterium]|nr:hypothetical protein [Bryobacteraceae bacterium]